MSERQHRLVFVGGLHRSGTTPLAKILGDHPAISSLTGTGVIEDEGQHLQSVYPPARRYGGSGHFARDARAHLTEKSPLATPENAAALMAAWTPFWDMSRTYLVEKSPPNMLMTRFLQALFPEACFVIIVRHPVTVALSTKKWTHLLSRNPRKFVSLSGLVEHWLLAHRLLAEDIPHLRRVHVVYYEDLVNRPKETLASVAEFLGVEGDIPAIQVSGGHSVAYEHWWDQMRSLTRPGGWQRRTIERRFKSEIAGYGYDLDNLSDRSGVNTRMPS